ncbi:hypothetical protein CY34DRAFT_378559 [Suillus luteus UH-Slu-Lm8-n1]|uniref:Unplaced genomic scaffold CY34scaffold_25, whole genome shotgun sequence n=1 Tax=Suillus luteus UH-Slu-Lm8-n1 TaxID=930992 RepID=A0A0D0BAA3_9AGAM|nr:hypothetical protein CY34DRAFT_378559 [Suillus luteus UH-Slu-Lm8-n1]
MPLTLTWIGGTESENFWLSDTCFEQGQNGLKRDETITYGDPEKKTATRCLDQSPACLPKTHTHTPSDHRKNSRQVKVLDLEGFKETCSFASNQIRTDPSLGLGARARECCAIVSHRCHHGSHG